jgi:hypothetical protein
MMVSWSDRHIVRHLAHCDLDGTGDRRTDSDLPPDISGGPVDDLGARWCPFGPGRGQRVVCVEELRRDVQLLLFSG